jgi:hypothetical protein
MTKCLYVVHANPEHWHLMEALIFMGTAWSALLIVLWFVGRS